MTKYTLHRTFFYLALPLVLGLAPGCVNLSEKRIKAKKVQAQQDILTPSAFLTASTPENPPITIWVHGTRLLPRNMLHRFFHSEEGLHPALALDRMYHLRTIADTLHATDPQKFPLQTFYLFGWSGKLNFHEREQAARILYKELKPVIAAYIQQYGRQPYIQIITHSHGGNLVLNLPKACDLDDTEFMVHELILLACPVQKKTQQFIHHPMFKKVYAFYSSLDMIQVIAPQLKYTMQRMSKGGKNTDVTRMPIFSARAFDKHPKLVQAKIKLNGRGILHTEFVLPKFLRLLPTIITKVDHWEDNKIAYTLAKVDTHKVLCTASTGNGRRMKKVYNSALT